MPAGRLPAEIRVCTLVLGGGVAGFRAALAAASEGPVLLVTKEGLADSNTSWAQGGVAAAVGPEDSPEAHREDTIAVGGGLCRPKAVAAVVGEGPARIEELLDWGAAFDGADADGQRPHLTREAGHRLPRILHANGDATGREFVRVLAARVRAHPAITVWDYAFAVDLLVEEGVCRGALVLRDRSRPSAVSARAVVLATGGAGRVYRETTNPAVATGDGVAMGLRAGAEVSDLEFVQFHPTTLYVAGAARTLITEAVRGEGGHLIDDSGERFVFRFHPDGELAPRDVVSRAIVEHIAEREESCAYLDLRHLGDKVGERFPSLEATCRMFRIDIRRDRIPVHPSAHYVIGGLVTDLHGATTLPGLFAAGEVAATGLHGANRLASNSLLEGLVFGERAGRAALEVPGDAPESFEAPRADRPLPRTVLNAPDMLNSVQALMWRRVGIIREGSHLERAVRQLDTWRAYLEQVDFDDVAGFETENILTVATAIARAAAWRRESRGTHFRRDLPGLDDEKFRVHGRWTLEGDLVGRID